MSGDTLVILNPAAGRGRARPLWERLSTEASTRKGSFRVHETSGRGDAIDRAKAWAEAGEKGAIIAVGGDGTVHEVVNGIQQGGGGVRLAVIPAGTGNDFVRNTGLAGEPVEALRAAIRGDVRRADLGRARFREAGSGTPREVVFVNSASVGVSPTANRYAQRIGRVLPGRLRYSLGGVCALLLAPRRLWRLRVEGRGREERLLNLTAANGAGFGGGMMISPGSSTSDGILDLVVIGEIGLARSLMALARLRRGGHIAMAGVTVTPTSEPVTIGAEGGPIHLEADGHDYRVQGDVQLTVLPGALLLAGGTAGRREGNSHAECP